MHFDNCTWGLLKSVVKVCQKKHLSIGTMLTFCHVYLISMASVYNQKINLALWFGVNNQYLQGENLKCCPCCYCHQHQQVPDTLVLCCLFRKFSLQLKSHLFGHRMSPVAKSSSRKYCPHYYLTLFISLFAQSSYPIFPSKISVNHTHLYYVAI